MSFFSEIEKVFGEIEAAEAEVFVPAETSEMTLAAAASPFCTLSTTALKVVATGSPAKSRWWTDSLKRESVRPRFRVSG